MNNSIITKDVDEIILSTGGGDRNNFSQLFGKSVLITGATGLIGTYLIYTLLKLNELSSDKIKIKIVIHNNLPEHLVDIKGAENVEIFQGDLSDFEFCSSLPNADFIIHAAGYGQPKKFTDKKLLTIRMNTLATDILISKLNAGGKFLFISTSEIYSGSKETPYLETTCGITNPAHARACYIEGKRCGEAICHAWQELGKDVKIARVALAYGPGVRPGDGRVLYNFIQKGLSGKINLLDSGKAGRVYCYVADTVFNLWNILLHGKEITYNVGGKSFATIRRLAELVGKILNVPVEVPESDDGMQGAPAEVSMNIDKTEIEFGKTDYLELETGLRRTIDWYKANIAQ